MKNAFTQTSLAKLRCSTPGCTDCDTILHMNPSCCEGAALDAVYDKTDGILVMSCDCCGRPLFGVEVAEGQKELVLQ